MCRYGFTEYKTHWACLPCRRTFKHYTSDLERCPSCREAMVDMGLDFQAPRRRAESQWRKLEMLVDAGIRFHSCGCSGPGYRPRTLSDAKTEMKQRRTDRKVWEPRRRPPRCGYHMGKYSKYLRELGT